MYQNATNSSITFIPRLVSDNKVLIVIGGDSNYRDEDEKSRSVISRWAKRKVASQFDEEYLDGRKSFIFSWDEKHRPIHEEAMWHFLDPSKRGVTFEYLPLPKPIAPVVPQPSRTSEVPKVPRPAIPYSRLEVGLTSLLHIPPPSLFSLLKRLFKVLTRNFFLITADLNGREGYDTIDDTKRRQPYQKAKSSSLIYFSSPFRVS